MRCSAVADPDVYERAGYIVKRRDQIARWIANFAFRFATPEYRSFVDAAVTTGLDKMREDRVQNCTRDPLHDGPCNGWSCR
jgi:hypothetical protein